MILQPYIPDARPEVPTGKKITMPGLGVDIKQVMLMYARGSEVERAKGYYEQQGMEVPDFDRMSHIEKLEALAELRKSAKQATEEINRSLEKAEAKRQDAILQNKVKQKVDAELKQRQSSDRQRKDGDDA